ncbi:MAG: polyprenyl synthetase family protein [Holophagales bacterium]|nr:MAG: polyprenyl synthetase family protein [Holophagales bacterium]
MSPHPSLAPTDPATAVKAERFLSLVADKLAATEELFRRTLDSDVPFIHQAGAYIAAGGGKRMRPALLLLCSQLLGHDGDEEVSYAAVVELLHNSTLIHDDIIDHANLRRGRRTLNELWGNSLTVLLGDWMYATAMRTALAHDNVVVITRLCDATLAMTEGELLSLERLGDSTLTRAQYLDIIDRKTAHLFSAACGIPALIPPARPEAQAALERYGRALGLCFQIVDDLLDFTGEEGRLGKPVLSDLKEGKLTLPLIAVRDRVGPERWKRVEWVLEDRDFVRVEPRQILELAREAGGLDEAAALALEQASAAKAALAGFPPSAAREALELAPDFVLHRRS